MLETQLTLSCQRNQGAEFGLNAITASLASHFLQDEPELAVRDLDRDRHFAAPITVRLTG